MPNLRHTQTEGGQRCLELGFFLQEAKLESVKEQLRLMEDKNLQALSFPAFSALLPNNLHHSSAQPEETRMCRNAKGTVG